ncbi:hypothetical protein HYW84_00865 [Candidatus Peregrinibacteria bacterium]|nr:hypothetical protein [Candidatus Peregrinibacteria bacterium]
MSRLIAFVLAEGPAAQNRERTVVVKPQKSAPKYYGEAAPKQCIIERAGSVTVKSYPPDVILAEVSCDVEDVFSAEAFAMRNSMIGECKLALQKHRAKLEMSEEYALAVVSGYEGPPEQFLRKGAAIAGFLKSEIIPLDESEIAYTLQTQLKYGDQDMVIIDWDGAFVFEPTGEADAVLELLELANLQLLRYRMLDGDLDSRLVRLEHLMRTKAMTRFLFWSGEVTRAFKEVIGIRASSIMEFDAIVREVKLIGDWYSARLYELAAKKLRLEDWRKAIREKLLSLEDIYGIVSQNFSISKQYFFEFALQAGWFTLLALELYQIFR